MMKFDFKPRHFFFRNKDPIEMQAVARTSKTFNIATQNAQYDCGLVLHATGSGHLKPENPKIFLESEFCFRDFSLAAGSKVIECPVLRGSSILPFINTVVISPFLLTEKDIETLEDDGIIMAMYHIHPMLLKDYVQFPEIESIFLNLPEVNLRAIQVKEFIFNLGIF